jgi:hypothetical protein
MPWRIIGTMFSKLDLVRIVLSIKENFTIMHEAEDRRSTGID